MKSLVKKQFIATALLIVAAFFVLALALIPLTYGVFREQASQTLQTCADGIASAAQGFLSERDGTVYIGSEFGRFLAMAGKIYNVTVQVAYKDGEIILCSCEDATRKPAPAFFRLALRKAGLSPEEVWYCGDNPRADVWGAHGAGLFPVHYVNTELPCPYRSAADELEPDFPHLRIGDWSELLPALDARQ